MSAHNALRQFRVFGRAPLFPRPGGRGPATHCHGSYVVSSGDWGDARAAIDRNLCGWQQRLIFFQNQLRSGDRPEHLMLWTGGGKFPGFEKPKPL